MATDIEAEALILYRSRQPPDVARISFEDLGMIALAGELVAGGQACRTSSDDDHSTVDDIRQYFFPRDDLVTSRRPTMKQVKIFDGD
jgi:hypothetical protein